jgi:hypothetical protein
MRRMNHDSHVRFQDGNGMVRGSARGAPDLQVRGPTRHFHQPLQLADRVRLREHRLVERRLKRFFQRHQHLDAIE